jgi:hypothetical protein
VTALATRRARLVRLRATEHRIAVARLAQADAARATLADIDERVATLRGAIDVTTGSAHGHDLQARAEMAGRLDGARAAIELSLVQARATCSARAAARLAAHVAECRTERVHSEATRRETNERELRLAAARSPRKPKREGTS